MAGKIETEVLDKRAVRMVMEFDDGTTESFDKGFIITASQPEPDDTHYSVKMVACAMSGKEMIDMAVTVLAPILSGGSSEQDNDF